MLTGLPGAVYGIAAEKAKVFRSSKPLDAFFLAGHLVPGAGCFALPTAIQVVNYSYFTSV
jgi:hypothetical protein